MNINTANNCLSYIYYKLLKKDELISCVLSDHEKKYFEIKYNDFKAKLEDVFGTDFIDQLQTEQVNNTNESYIMDDNIMHIDKNRLDDIAIKFVSSYKYGIRFLYDFNLQHRVIT